MDSFTVRQQDDPKVPAFQFRDLAPSPDAAVLLNVLAHRSCHGPADPLILDDGAVGPLSHELEVTCAFHRQIMAERLNAVEIGRASCRERV